MDTILEVLAESSVRAIVIAAATALVLWGMRVKSPAIRHRAWTGVLVTMLFLPFISVWSPRIVIPVLPEDAGFRASQIRNVAQEFIPPTDLEGLASKTTDFSMPATVKVQMPIKSGERTVSLFEAVSILYLLGFGVFMARLLAGMLLSYRLGRKTRRDDNGFHCPQCSVPLTVGLLRPRILLPVESKEWDEHKLAAVLIHEREHVRRRDPLVEWLAVLNRGIYWFHPLAWWLCRKLAALAEQACDEAVLANGHDCEAYAEFLLELARSVKRRGLLVTAWGSSIHGSTLSLRIRRILTSGLSPALSQARLVLVAALCATAAFLPAVCELAHAQKVPPDLPAVKLPISITSLPETGVAQNKPAESSSPSTRHVLSVPPEKILYEKGMKLHENKQYKDTRLAFQTLLSAYPESKLAAPSFLAVGDSFMNEGGPENMLQAEDQYRKFIMFFPDDPKAFEARMKIISLNMKMLNKNDRDWQYYYKMLNEMTKLKEQDGSSDTDAIVAQMKKQSQDSIFKLRPYLKWLFEDVVYIITEEEKKAFTDLKDDAERDRFIEQFWARRNPDPGSSNNAFKEEHYRRIAYANEHFASIIPGWLTDRGRTYIKWGEPDEVEAHPAGGSYRRPDSEGGGTITTYSFEKWHYLHVKGVGVDIWMEFVDASGIGNYRLANHPDEKVMPKPGSDKNQ
jgi:GWxTD domain-containing protein